MALLLLADHLTDALVAIQSETSEHHESRKYGAFNDTNHRSSFLDPLYIHDCRND